MREEETNHLNKSKAAAKEIILDIQDGVRYVWSKKWILVVSGIIGGLLGLWYAFLNVPTYTATTRFVVESGDAKGGGLSRLAGMASVAGIDLGGDAGGLFQGDNILELYRSRRMLTKALLTYIDADSTELLVERYLDFTGAKEKWNERPDLLALDFRQDPAALSSQKRRLRDSIMTSLVNTLKNDVLTVDRPDPKLSIVQVNVSSSDEIFSKTFNENLVREVNRFYIQTKTKKSTDNIAVLQRKVDSVRAVMTGSIYTVARVSDATPNLNPTRQVQRVVPSQEAQFSVEANRTILSQLLQNLELTKMNLMQEQPLIQLIDEPVYPLKVERLGKLKSMVIGGFLLGFLALLGSLGIRYYEDVMSEETKESEEG